MSEPDMFRYSHTIGTYFGPRTSPGFSLPVDVALGPNRILYVLSRGGPATRVLGKRIQMCSIEGEYLGVCPFGATGTGDDMMMWPASIVAGADGRLYVTDEALHRVSVLSSEGKILGNWGAEGSGEGEFNRPSGITFDRDGYLLVVDGLNDRIQRYTTDGRFVNRWGRTGNGDGEFNMPWGITVDRAGDIYVADWRNDRIQKFDAQGRHLATWGSSGQGEGEFHRPSGLAVDADGDIYVADWGNERVQVLGPDGSYMTQFRGEAGLSIMSEFYYSVSFQHQLKADQEAQKDFEQNPPDFESARDESGTIEKLLWAPTSVKLDDEGRIYIADTCRYRVQVYLKEPRPHAPSGSQERKAAAG